MAWDTLSLERADVCRNFAELIRNRLAGLASTLSVEKDWVPTLCKNDKTRLASLNALFRRLSNCSIEQKREKSSDCRPLIVARLRFCELCTSQDRFDL